MCNWKSCAHCAHKQLEPRRSGSRSLATHDAGFNYGTLTHGSGAGAPGSLSLTPTNSRSTRVSTQISRHAQLTAAPLPHGASRPCLAGFFLRSRLQNERRGLACGAGWLDGGGPSAFCELALRRNAERPLAGSSTVAADLLGATAMGGSIGGSAGRSLRAAGRAPRAAWAGLSCALAGLSRSQASLSPGCGPICSRGESSPCATAAAATAGLAPGGLPGGGARRGGGLVRGGGVLGRGTGKAGADKAAAGKAAAGKAAAGKAAAGKAGGGKAAAGKAGGVKAAAAGTTGGVPGTMRHAAERGSSS